jgi:hypothetical protein
MRTVLSTEAEASCAPSGDHARSSTSAHPPRRRQFSLPSHDPHSEHLRRARAGSHDTATLRFRHPSPSSAIHCVRHCCFARPEAIRSIAHPPSNSAPTDPTCTNTIMALSTLPEARISPRGANRTQFTLAADDCQFHQLLFVGEGDVNARTIMVIECAQQPRDALVRLGDGTANCRERRTENVRRPNRSTSHLNTGRKFHMHTC